MKKDGKIQTWDGALGIFFCNPFIFNLKKMKFFHFSESGDPCSNMVIEFGSKEDAIVYCERMGKIFDNLF